MILNNFVVSYLVMSIISLAVCVPASLVAWVTARGWKSGMTCEEQAQLEKKVYLVITLLCLGFFIRLFMIPLWFLTIQSLIPSIPGAMCMAGIHLLDTPVSYIATILKFFIPLAYIYWLILDGADRRIECQPFMRMKLMIVIPLALLMASESALDIHFLLKVKPVIVSCCTSLFDTPHAGMLKLIRGEGAAWISLFFTFFALTLISSLISRFVAHRVVKGLSALSSLLALVFLVLALHTKVSPLMLEAPYHQCVFCLWQGIPDCALASASAILGLWLTFVVAALPDLKNYPAAMTFAGKLQSLALILFSAGTLVIVIRYALKLFS
jgi:hypothetical protein